MKICAVICEFNPFHNGHAYLLGELKRKLDAALVCIMSGNFVQRGEPALFPKEHRTLSALLGGADLVLELPLPYATETAQRFAFGGISLIQSLGCVTHLGFGCELQNLSLLQTTATLIDSPEIQQEIKKQLEKGISFATAREQALRTVCPSVADLIKSPNNILAVEYLRQLAPSSVEPVPILRIGASHHDTHLQNKFSSATAIRRQWREDSKLVDGAVPVQMAQLYRKLEQQGDIFTNQNGYESMVLSSLRGMSVQDLSQLSGISEGLEHRFAAAIAQATTLEELYSITKTKRYSHARIRRLALAGFLKIPKALSLQPPPYGRILGMNATGIEILKQAKQHSSIPLSHSLTKLSKINSVCGEYAKLESFSTDQYALLLKHPKPMHTDLRFSPIVV